MTETVWTAFGWLATASVTVLVFMMFAAYAVASRQNWRSVSGVVSVGLLGVAAYCFIKSLMLVHALVSGY